MHHHTRERPRSVVRDVGYPRAEDEASESVAVLQAKAKPLLTRAAQVYKQLSELQADLTELMGSDGATAFQIQLNQLQSEIEPYLGRTNPSPHLTITSGLDGNKTIKGQMPSHRAASSPMTQNTVAGAPMTIANTADLENYRDTAERILAVSQVLADEGHMDISYGVTDTSGRGGVANEGQQGFVQVTPSAKIVAGAGDAPSGEAKGKRKPDEIRSEVKALLIVANEAEKFLAPSEVRMEGNNLAYIGVIPNGASMTVLYGIRELHEPAKDFSDHTRFGLPSFGMTVHLPREELVGVIDSHINTSTEKPIVVSGPEGVGKSHLARYYCYQLLQESPKYQFIGWVQGGDAEITKQSFYALGRFLEIIPRDMPQEIGIEKIKNFFEHQSNWLLVLDDIQQAQWLLGMLPDVLNQSHIIITTRNTNKMVPGENRVTVDLMNEEESIQLLQDLSGCISDEEIELLGKLAAKVNYLPSKLVKAGYYMMRHQSRKTVADCLTAYDMNPAECFSNITIPRGYKHQYYLESQPNRIVSVATAEGYVDGAAIPNTSSPGLSMGGAGS